MSNEPHPYRPLFVEDVDREQAVRRLTARYLLLGSVGALDSTEEKLAEIASQRGLLLEEIMKLRARR